MKILRALAIVAFLIVLAQPASAGINEFTSPAIDGAIVYDVEYVANGAALASTPRGLYRSVDQGVTWTSVLRYDSYFPARLAANPANRNQVVFGGWSLYRSNDAGITWSVVAGTPATALNLPSEVAFAPDGATAWLSLANGGLFRSTDGGTTWSANLNPAGTTAVHEIKFDAANSASVYITTGNGGFHSLNGGTSFTQVAFSPFVSTIEPSRTTPGVVLAVDATTDFAYLSTDDGSSFNALAPPRRIGSLHYVPGVAGRVFGVDLNLQRLIRSSDNGQTWNDLGPLPNGRVFGMAFDPADASRVLLACYGGVFASSDGGVNWIERIAGLRDVFGHRVIASRAGAGAVFFATTDLASVYRRDAASGAWSGIGAGSVPTLGYPASESSINGHFALAAAPQDLNVLYMARDGFFGSTVDGGAHWVTNAAVGQVDELAVSPHDTQIVYAGAMLGQPQRTTNGGQSWAPIAGLPPAVRTWAFDPQNSSIVYGAIDNHLPGAPSAVYKSVDGGATWNPTPWNNALATSIVWRIAIDPTRPSTLYVSSFHGIDKTTDGGATWTRSVAFDPLVSTAGASDLVIDPQSPDIVYAAAWTRAVIARSVNGGATWELMASETGQNGGFSHLALVPGSRTKLVAARRVGVVEYEFAPNLAISSASAAQVAGTAGSTVFTITNGSGISVTGVRIEAQLPVATGSYTVQGTGCVVTDRQLACALGTLGGAQSATVTVGFTAAAAGSWSGTVSAYEPDAVTTNNTFVAQVNAATPPSSGGGSGSGGGGGALDYLLLAALAALTLRGARAR